MDISFHVPVWALWLLGAVLLVRLPISLWVFYLAVMNLKAVRDSVGLHPRALWLGTLVLLEGYVRDVFVNLLLTFILFELPRELTVTERLKRHNVPSTTTMGKWRYKVAQWFEPILDPHDPSGNHI